MDLYAQYAKIVSSFRQYLEGEIGAKGCLSILEEKVKGCKLCRLSKTRTNVVFGYGDPMARVLIIGEAPGHEEDIKGKPFVGRAGELLERMLLAIRVHREETYITNILKCRPPGNRDPSKDEIEGCLPYLLLQISIISPSIILTLGNFASKAFLSKDLGIERLRGKVYEVNGMRFVPTFHPSYLLRNPEKKRLAWEDMKLLRMEIDRLRL